MNSRKSIWPFAIAGWSGFYVMLVELLSGRLIAPFFGNNIYVWGSVIFIFMLALSVGYLLGGIYSRHNASLRRLCAILALSALTTLPTLVFGDALLNFVFDHIADPRTGSLVSCFALYFVPTMFAGMICPMPSACWSRTAKAAAMIRAISISSPPWAAAPERCSPRFIWCCGSR